MVSRRESTSTETMTVVIRRLSNFVKHFFSSSDFDMHLRSTRIAQGCWYYENRTERRASSGQCRQIFVFVIRYAILPAAKHDANPFEGQGSHRGMVVLAALALLPVIGAGPRRLRNRVSCPFVKTLPQKLGTGPAEMHPFLLPTRLRHGCDPAVFLYLVGAAVTIPL